MAYPIVFDALRVCLLLILEPGKDILAAPREDLLVAPGSRRYRHATIHLFRPRMPHVRTQSTSPRRISWQARRLSALRRAIRSLRPIVRGLPTDELQRSEEH